MLSETHSLEKLFNNLGNTPMHLAAMYNHYSCIDALLKHQSEAMDIQNDHGMTPLQVFSTRTMNGNGYYNWC